MSRPSVAVSIRSPNSLATLWKTSSVLSDSDRASTGFSSCRSPVDAWLLNFLRTLCSPLALNSTSRFAQVLPQGDWSNSSEHQSVIEEQKGGISRLAGDEDPVVDPASAGERQADHSEADPELDGEAKLDPDRVDGTGVSNVNVEIDIAHANQEAEESKTAASPGADSTIPGHARVDSPDARPGRRPAPRPEPRLRQGSVQQGQPSLRERRASGPLRPGRGRLPVVVRPRGRCAASCNRRSRAGGV